MTPAQIQALFVLDRLARQLPAGSPGVRPREFARAVWPDAPGWKVSVRTGPNGSHAGRQLYTAGGAWLARLAKAGLVRQSFHNRHGSGGFDYGWRLTRDGQALLDAAAADDAATWQDVIFQAFQLLKAANLEPFGERSPEAVAIGARFVLDPVTFQLMQRQAIRQERGGKIPLRELLTMPQQLLGYDVVSGRAKRGELRLEGRI